MFPDLLTLQTPFGVQALHTYGLLLILGFFAATLVTGARMRQVGMNSDRLVPLMLIAIPSSILGARLLHFLGSTDRADFLAAPWILFDLTQGGMAFLGGAIGGVISGSLYAKRAGLNVWKMADVGAPMMLPTPTPLLNTIATQGKPSTLTSWPPGKRSPVIMPSTGAGQAVP